MSSNATLFEASNNDIPLIELSSACDNIFPINVSMDLSDQLLFIQFTPDGTMRYRWYLIQVDMESTMQVNVEYSFNHIYWCVFLAKYQDDNKKSDGLCR